MRIGRAHRRLNVAASLRAFARPIRGVEAHFHIPTHDRYGTTKPFGDDAGGLFARGDQVAAGGDAGQQPPNIRWRDHFQKGIGGIVLQAPDFAGGVVECEALGGAELPNERFVKPLFCRDAEVILVAEMDDAEDAPEVVDPVWVVERHAPAVWLGRETAQKEHASPDGQEGLERMALRRSGSNGGCWFLLSHLPDKMHRCPGFVAAAWSGSAAGGGIALLARASVDE